MLVLTQRIGDTVHIDNDIEIKVLKVFRGKAVLGYTAPRNKVILREKLLKENGNEDDDRK